MVGIDVPARDVNAPLGMRMAIGGMCSNESGIEKQQDVHRRAPLHSLVLRPLSILGPVVPGNVGLVAIEDVHIEASGAIIC